MLKSMTAYGRACVSLPLGRFVAEIQSSNRKHLEITVSLPKELSRFEPDIKKWITALVFRGKVTAKISVLFEKTGPSTLSPNIPLVKQLKNAWEDIAKEIGLDPEKKLSLDLFKDIEGILYIEEDMQNEEEFREGLKLVLHDALVPFQHMRETEGSILENDIRNRLGCIRKKITIIQERAPDATKKFREKLKEKIEELLPGAIENEERILREIAVYAEKIDITEELVRFDSHLVQIQNLLSEGCEGVAKTFEFLLQEMNREINTISAKSSDTDVSKLVIDIKSDIERIREQIQNIE